MQLQLCARENICTRSGWIGSKKNLSEGDWLGDHDNNQGKLGCCGGRARFNGEVGCGNSLAKGTKERKAQS